MSEEDPTGRTAGEPGAKLDAGKPRMGLLLDFRLALTEVAKVSTYGAEKYSPGGWLEVPDGHARYTDAMLRHAFMEKIEPINHQDGDLLTMAQTAWNALARLELYLRENK